MEENELFIDKSKNKKINKFLINEIYKLISKQEKNNNKNLIRSIFVGWDNYTRYSNLRNNVTTFLLPNSFDFYFICLKQFILLYKENKKNNNKYHKINA